MASTASAWVQTHPSYIMPEVILQYAQASGAFELLPGGDPMVRLSTSDLMAYIRAFDVRQKVAAGNSAYNSLPSVQVVPRMISTPTYLIRLRNEYDHHDSDAMSEWGVSLPDAYRLGSRQGCFQQLRNVLLYGYNPANGEGLLNANGALAVSLPPDPTGATTVVTYDNGAMGVFLLTQVQALKTRCLQMGTSSTIVICGPQRVLGAMEYQNIVQLTQYQRVGGGTLPTAGMIKNTLEMNKDNLIWVYDDTLIGKGAGGTDAVVMNIPEVKKPRANKLNTNEFAKLANGLEATSVQLLDMAAPREIPTPLPGGAIDVLFEMKSTSGWVLRGESVVVISMQYQ